MSAWLAAKRSGVRSPSAPPKRCKMAKNVAAAMDNIIKKLKETDIGSILEDARKKIDEIYKNPSKHMGVLLLQLELAYEMLRCYYKKECKFPLKTAIALAAALVYFLNPFDIIPDFIPGIGYIDDLAALGIAFKLIRDDLREYAISKGLDLSDYGLD